MAKITTVHIALSGKRPLPGWLTPVSVWASALTAARVPEGISDRFRIQRSGGYGGLDLVLFLLGYWLSDGVDAGLKEFHRRARPNWRQLSAVFGRRLLPSPPSVSRMLNQVDGRDVASFGLWLLTTVPNLSALIAHRAVQYRDARGAYGHVFDYDPKHKGLRQRALPAHEDMPDGVRLGPRVGKPGHAGRKRGELHLNRSVLQHAGSGIIVQMGIGAGSGDLHGQHRDAVNAAATFCDEQNIPREMAIFRTDGAYGGLPYIEVVADAGLRFVVRSSRYALLDDPHVRAALAQADWRLVPDSGSGPTRSAADMGLVSHEKRRFRVVVSRYPAPKQEETKRGRLIDGVCYELYVTDLDDGAWPAPELVELYYGRCGFQESRFNQENRELKLDRIWAYHLPGQLLATLVGAVVWNLRIVAGFEANRPASEAPAVERAGLVEDKRTIPALSVGAETSLPPEIEPPSTERELSPAERVVESRQERSERQKRASAQMLRIAPRLFVGSRLERTGWTLTTHPLGLICARGEPFRFLGAYALPEARSIARFVAVKQGTCTGCPLARGCRREKRGKDDYTPALTLTQADTARLDAAKSRQPRTIKGPPMPVVLAIRRSAGLYRAMAPSFLPAESRKITTRGLEAVSVDVIHDQTACAPGAAHQLIASTVRHRRHGRCTHQENLGRYALPSSASVTIRIHSLPRHREPLAGVRRAVRSSAFQPNV